MTWKRSNRPLVAIFAYNILYMAASGLLVPGTPLYLSTNGFEGGMLNMTLSLMAVSSLLGQIIWGYLSDRVATKLTFVELGTLSYILGYVLLMVLRDRLATALVLIASNFVGSASYPAAMSLLADLSSDQNRGRSMGVFWSAASFGWAASVAFTGFIVERLGGVYFFGACSLLLLSSLLSVYIGFRGERQHTATKRLEPNTKTSFLRSFLGLEAPFLVFLSCSVIFFMADYVKNVYVPMFYAFELGMGMVIATLLLSLTSWIEIPVNILFGSLSDRFGRKRMVLLGYALCGTFMIVNSLAAGFEGALIAMCLYGFVWGAFSGASSALASELVDEGRRGFAMGLFNSSWTIASMFAPASMGMLVQVFGYRLMFEVMGTLMLLSCILLVLGVRRDV
jgi:DHA1 family multidrug resistance protein-like MFS transporter